jgi:hypothetical protein
MLQHMPLTHVGLDVSKASISVALLRPDGHLDEDRIANTPESVRSLVRRWPAPSTVRVCYEAGPTGYDLYRQLAASASTPPSSPTRSRRGDRVTGSRPIGVTPASWLACSVPASSRRCGSPRPRRRLCATSCGPARI